MARVVVFAHFDKNNIIQDYIIYYLKKLKNISQTLIFVSDCNLPEAEIFKIDKIADKIIAKPHGEYDFGSYKLGYKYLYDLNLLSAADELIFANDSCIGPLCAFEHIWNVMDEKDCDFWGISKNTYREIEHVQSFFLVFKRNVFYSDIFKEFIFGIEKQKTKSDIILKYELGLSKMLLEKGYHAESFLDFPIGEALAAETLLSKEMQPLIKTSTVRKVHILVIKIILKYFCCKFGCDYPVRLVDKYSRQNRCSKSLREDINFIRRIFIRLHFKERRIYFLGKWYGR